MVIVLMIYIYDDLENIKYNDYLEMNEIIKKYNEKLIKERICYKDRLNNILSIFIIIMHLHKNDKVDEISTYNYSQKNKPIMRNIKFNISHCSEAVAVAINDNEDVGVDVETRIFNYTDLKKYVLSNNEINCNEIDEKIFRKIWTLKESYLKFTEDGLFENMKEIDFFNYIDKTEFEFNKLKFYYYESEKYCLSVCCFKKLNRKILTYKEIKKYIKILK